MPYRIECVCHGFCCEQIALGDSILIVVCAQEAQENARLWLGRMATTKGEATKMSMPSFLNLVELAKTIDHRGVAVVMLRPGNSPVCVTTGPTATNVFAGPDTDGLGKRLPYAARDLVPGAIDFLNKLPHNKLLLKEALQLSLVESIYDKHSRMIAALSMDPRHRACSDEMFVTRAIVNRLLGLDLV